MPITANNIENIQHKVMSNIMMTNMELSSTVMTITCT